VRIGTNRKRGKPDGNGTPEEGMNPHAVNLAVVAGRGDRKDNVFNLNRGEFHGTAFCVAPHLFITAGHVYNAAAAAGDVALGRLGPPKPQVQLVRDAEVYPDVDLALLYCPNLAAEILPVNFAPLTWLTDVVAIGYAFGLELTDLPGESHVYQLRAFKGYVMNRRGLTQLRGVPPGYEVSFVPPPGLSGAPLLLPTGDSFAITGVVLKHHTAELAERQMDLGLAVDSEELLTLESRFVGGSIAERLFRRERIPLRNRHP
jgi:hypothetical protein